MSEYLFYSFWKIINHVICFCNTLKMDILVNNIWCLLYACRCIWVYQMLINLSIFCFLSLLRGMTIHLFISCQNGHNYKVSTHKTLVYGEAGLHLPSQCFPKWQVPFIFIGEIQGSYQIKVTTTALALLISTRHPELSKFEVQGHLIKVQLLQVCVEQLALHLIKVLF